MGEVFLARNDFTRAAASYRRSLRLSIELGVLRAAPACVAGLAVAAASVGDTKQAGELWGAVSTLERELGVSASPVREDALQQAHSRARRHASSRVRRRRRTRTGNECRTSTRRHSPAADDRAATSGHTTLAPSRLVAPQPETSPCRCGGEVRAGAPSRSSPIAPRSSDGTARHAAPPRRSRTCGRAQSRRRCGRTHRG